MVRTIMPHAPTTLDAALPAYQPAETEQFIDLHKSALYRYLDEITNQEVYLDNQGLELDDSDGDKVLVHIDELYVVPHLSEQRISPEELVEAGEEQEELDELPLRSVAEMLSKYPRAVILGDPGVGKSTLLKWLLCSLSHWSDNYARRRIGPLFPLLLRARNLTADTIAPCDNDDFIQLLLRLQGKSLSECITRDSEAYRVLKDRLACGQVLLMVDGLDEASDRVKAWLAEQIKQLLSDYPKNRLLMTSRVVGFEQAEFWCETPVEKARESGLAHDFTAAQQRLKLFSGSDKQAEDMLASQNAALNLPQTLFLVPFLPDQRRSFVKNWSEKYLPPQQERRFEFQENLDDVSDNVKQINLLSRIPVLLNLICFIQWRRGQLPDGRAELYQRIVGTYLESMDKVRNMAPDFNDHYDYKDIRNWLGKLAFCMHAGDLCLPEDSLDSLSDDEEKLEALREALPVIGQQDMLLQISQTELEAFLALQLSEVMSVQDAKRQCIKLIDYLKCRTGFIIPKGQEEGVELYGFSHLSFQEYFAAYFISLNLGTIKEESEKVYNALGKSVDQSEWGEIWSLVFEELSIRGNSRKQMDGLFNQLFPYSSNEFFYASEVRANIAANLAVKISNKSRVETFRKITESLIASKLSFKYLFYSISKAYLQMNKNELNRIVNESDSISLFEGTFEVESFTGKYKFSEVDLYTRTTSFIDSLPSMEIRSLSIFPGKPQSLPSLQKFHGVRKLIIHGEHISGVLEPINLPDVKEVTLHQGTSTLIKSIFALKSLEHLTLSEVDLKDLPEQSNIESLFLVSCNVNDFCFLSCFKRVTSLFLWGCYFEEGLCWNALLEMTDIKEININSSNSISIPPHVEKKLSHKGVTLKVEID
ncbi:NACHT domain-containing protein [Pseudoalteromonas rubra]|uniref:NACHT domain-containing protein n=1 Tax=Pseudoalteromonas rubra TaxID=43658 RepID=UPI000F7A1579|nr:NACHT domain-containing protein [Pseudoalteromonas rubra]